MSKQICIDLEMNQPSGKIIQLGYVIYRVPKFEVLETRRIYINPQERLEPAIEKLCRISEEQLLQGTTLEDAYQTLCTDMSSHKVNSYAVQWGLDHYILREQLNLEWKDFVFRRESLNVKLLYYSLFTGRSRGRRGLHSAMQSLGMAWDASHGLFHDALADAHNTMRVYQNLYRRMQFYDAVQNSFEESREGGL